MDKKKTLLRRIAGWALWLLVIVAALFALQVTVLAFPQLIVPQSVQVGSVKLYHDGFPEAEINQLAAEVERRLQASGFYDSSRTHRVFFFKNQGLYTLFARLTMVTPLAQGFGLSVFDNSFVSATRVNALGKRTGKFPPYSVWEGDPAHTMAHEIAHDYMIDRIGRGKWQQLPQWKQEGFPEYVANIGLIREDSLATLSNRFMVLNDDRAWRGRYGWDRIHYEAGLLVEFLIDVQNYRLDEIVADSITRDETLAALNAWSGAQQ
ncbi:hypothetical protein ACFLQW_00345 [Candidatus Zixiibacteriota bacterium]